VSYTVLAVKWRPRQFAELVGQPHVVQALVNSLEHERLHHAYLFSGTRGVGKTTIARLLAKALNCRNGVVAEPCGTCDACVAIDEGRFVDLIEVDAASRTRVDDTRELLDNVQYAPTHGRYKVYLIDEVHMLSNHSFNALLKTLEEPPPHVKFLLATTDPQKLPVTVLSRCLQFHLKKLTVRQILEQLRKICDAESVDAEDTALESIARAAEGSLRDALSLLDQAIAFGGGEIRADQTHAMLGTIDRNHVARILEALASGDGAALIDASAQLDEQAADFSAALDELMQALQRIAVVQLVGRDNSDDAQEHIANFAQRLSPEDVQLYYQIALNGRRDLAWCRDARMGFEMTLLRMLAFRPDDGARQDLRESAASTPRQRPGAAREGGGGQTVESAPTGEKSGEGRAARLRVVSSEVASRPATGDVENWGALIVAAELRGAARQMAENCEIERSTARRLDLILSADKSHLLTDQIRSRLQSELSRHLGRDLTVSIRPGQPPRKTPAEIRLENESERMRSARESVETDSNVKAMQSAFDAVVEADSIRPVD
jgi:DNA polymerase-3 subunit gamma/tau